MKAHETFLDESQISIVQTAFTLRSSKRRLVNEKSKNFTESAAKDLCNGSCEAEKRILLIRFKSTLTTHAGRLREACLSEKLLN